MANPWDVVKTEPAAADPWAVVSQAPADAPEPEMSFMDKVMADLKSIPKMTGRALADVGAGVTEGVASLPAMAMDFVPNVVNSIRGQPLQDTNAELRNRLAEVAPEGAGGPVRQAAAMAGGMTFNPANAVRQGAPANFRGDLTGRTGAQEVAEKGANMGLRVNPANAQLEPGRGTRLLGWLSNTPKVEDALSRGNQPAMQRIVSEGGELQQGEPLTRDMMAQGRDRIGQIYAQVKQSGPLAADDEIVAAQADPGVARAMLKKLGRLDGAKAEDAVTAWQKLRDEAAGAYAGIESGVGNRTVLRESARTNEAAADALKAWIDRGLRAQGKTDLAEEFLTAPQRIAQSHTLTDAVIPGAKSVDASVLARALDNNVPLRGEPRSLAEFATTFPQSVRSPVSASPVAQSGASVGNAGAAIGSAMTGGSGAAFAARGTSVPGISHIANAMLMRDSMQPQASTQLPADMSGVYARLIAALQAGVQ